MHGSAFGGVVREVTLGVAHDAGHGGDDDDGSGHVAAGFGGGLEER